MLRQPTPWIRTQSVKIVHHGQTRFHPRLVKIIFSTPQRPHVNYSIFSIFSIFSLFSFQRKRAANISTEDSHTTLWVHRNSYPYFQNFFQIYKSDFRIQTYQALHTISDHTYNNDESKQSYPFWIFRQDKQATPAPLKHKPSIQIQKFEQLRATYFIFRVFRVMSVMTQLLRFTSYSVLSQQQRSTCFKNKFTNGSRRVFSISIVNMNPTLASSTPKINTANRFAVLMNDATNPTPVKPPPPVITPPPAMNQAMNDEEAGPWLMPPLKKNATNRKKGNKAKQSHALTVQIPKTIPTPVVDKTFPDQNKLNKFAMDCRIKVQAHESVNPSRLLTAVLTIFQHAEPKTALTTSMYNGTDCPMLLDPSDIPITEAKLAPFISSWKKLRDDLFLCRVHMISASPLELIKKNQQVLEYLKKEFIVVEKATLESADHLLVGFLVNVVPDPDSTSAQQDRFELLLGEIPGFQLVTRKLIYKENSKLWSTVLKIRVDRADADEVSIAFQAASSEHGDFQYYAFDQYTGLHPDQKRYIVETQRNFLLQNRSVVIEWNIRSIPGFVMWMEEQFNWEDSDEDIMMDANRTTVQFKESTHEQASGQQGKRKHDGSQSIDNETISENGNTTKRRPVISKMVNNVDLTKVGIDDFLYSYCSGDGSPLIRYLYPVVDGKREALVSRSKRSEVNSFLKIIMLELARHMSTQSRIAAFNNPDEITQAVDMSSQWSPLNIHTMVPFSTTAMQPNQRKNKRRTTDASTNGGSDISSDHGSTPSSIQMRNTEVATLQSSITGQSANQPSTAFGSSNFTLTNSHQEEMAQVKEQIRVMKQQHTKLYENVQQMAKPQMMDTTVLQTTIEQNQSQLQSYVQEALDQTTAHITTNVNTQVMESIGQLRRETQAVDQRHTEAHKQLKAEFSSEVSAAITALTTVVADIKLGQSNISNIIEQQSKLIHQFSMEKENDQNLQDDQVELFLNNVKAAANPINVVNNSGHQPVSMTDPPSQSHISSLPSTIGRVALTTLTGLNKRGGRGGGRVLHQQTIHQSHNKNNLSGILEPNPAPAGPTLPSNIAIPSTHPPSNILTNNHPVAKGGEGNHHT